MNLADLTERKVQVMHAAAQRWKDNLPQFAASAERLARGGPIAATNPARAASFIARESAKRATFHGIGFERIIGDTVDLEDVPPNVAARNAGRPVARIVEMLDRTRIGQGFATGFVVGPGLLMTNWHVFANARDAIGCAAQFGFEKNENGLIDQGVVFELDPDSFFISNESLDVALVGIKNGAALGSETLSSFGVVRLIPSQGKILVGHPVNIIQHPDGRHKHWAVRQNKMLTDPKDEDRFITYTTDTLPGSSGAPGFNHDWELVAVHHSGVPRIENGRIITKYGTVWQTGTPDSIIDWVANEGARVSKVYGYLHDEHLPDAESRALLTRLVSASTDPILEKTLPGPLGQPVISTQSTGGSMNVVVNGTANFYFGTDKGEPQLKAEPLPPSLRAVSVGIEKKLLFDSDYDHRPGYKPNFLTGFNVLLPTAPAGEVLKEGGQVRVLDYHHYSLVMHKARRLVMWAASNIDYDPNKRWRTREEFGTDTWKGDPRIPIEAQIEDLEFYQPAAKFDRGHVVRRDDVAWGNNRQEEEFGNSDSFHWTNCTPQHEGFNRDVFGYHGLWGQLENHIAKQVGFLQNQLILFAGPVLDNGDISRDFGSGIPVKVPMVFWKIVIAVEDANQSPKLRAYGFFLDQTDAIQQYGWEGRFRAGKFKEQQVSLAEITQTTRVRFQQEVYGADPLANVPHEAKLRPLRTLADVRLR